MLSDFKMLSFDRLWASWDLKQINNWKMEDEKIWNEKLMIYYLCSHFEINKRKRWREKMNEIERNRMNEKEYERNHKIISQIT